MFAILKFFVAEEKRLAHAIGKCLAAI